MTAQPIIDTHVSETRPPALCDVCGMDMSVHKEAVMFIRHIKGEDAQDLAALCIQCYCDGVMWAAKAARDAKTTKVQGDNHARFDAAGYSEWLAIANMS